MSLNAHLFARYRRAALVAIPVALVAASSAPAQTPQPSAPVATPDATGSMVRDIRVRGTQRIEPGSVLSYMSIHVGDPYDEKVVDQSLKTLFATGLFADVKINWDGAVLTVNVENPIINQIVFEGES